MAAVVKAVWENGVFRPKEPVKLEERTEVEVVIPATTEADEAQLAADWKDIDAMVGFIHEEVEEDAITDPDRHIYRLPH